MATFDFSRLADIKQIAGDRIDRVVRGTLLDLTARVIRDTPVGDPDLWLYNRGTKQDPDYVDYLAYQEAPAGYVGGTAKGNWQAAINSEPKGEVARVDEDGDATISAAKAAIDGAPGNIYYLTNNVPYIERLEFEGWSSQSPAGMVRVNLRQLDQDIDAQIARLPS